LDLKFQKLKEVPIVFHNLQNYVSYLFTKKLVKFGEKSFVIACTEEKYMTITKMFMTERS